MTLLDQAEAWIESMCVAEPRLRSCVEDIEELAREQAHAWDARSEAVLAVLQERDHDGAGQGLRGFGGRSVHYASARVIRAFRQGHESLSVLWGAPDDPLPRQHRALVLVTLTLSILCVGARRPARPPPQRIRRPPHPTRAAAPRRAILQSSSNQPPFCQ